MYSINRSQVYDYFHDNAKALIDEYLDPDGQGKGWICPLCGNGSGEDGDGIVYDPNSEKPGYFKCFVCGFYGDLIDLIGEHNGITDDLEKQNKACEIFGLEIINDKTNSTSNDFKGVSSNQSPLLPPAPQKQPPKKSNDTKGQVLKILEESLEGKEGSFSYLFHKANKQLNNPEAIKYITGRGISADNPFLKYMGYLENHECGIRWGKDKFKGCIAFFGSNSSYGVRDIYPVLPDLDKTMKPGNKDGKHPDIPIGLLDVIKNKNKTLEGTEILEPVFICEGYFDAPSIAEAGADAISLNGTGNINPVIWAFEKWDIKRPLNLVLDNDTGGKDGLKSIIEKLDKTDIEYYITQFCPEGSDPNDFLTDNRKEFIKQVKTYQHLPLKEFEATFNRNKKEMLKNALLEKVKHPGIRTGFSTLDSESFLDGGLYSGLYVIGAISSLGKTTFALQLADQIAKSGQDVIFFSLEMPETEIMGKSISRNTLKSLLDSGKLKQNEKPDGRAKSLHDIYRDYIIDNDRIISEAIDRYFNDTGDHLRIIEGIGNKNADDIREEVKNHIKATGNTPVVFIDYLQLLIQPRDKKYSMTDKQITDDNVFKLKQISRDFKTPIFGISSFNRDNYNEPVSMKSFKESGAIEYSSDVLIGLEPEYMGIEDDTKGKTIRKKGKEEYKKREEETGIRSIRLVMLKNRNGRAGGVDMFYYYPKYNYYLERGNQQAFNDFKGLNFPK